MFSLQSFTSHHSGFLIFDSSITDIVKSQVQPCGKVSSSDCESYALQLGILSALNVSSSLSSQSPDFRTISDLQIFTDSIASTKLLFDYSAHSAHQDTLAVAPPLARWLTLSSSNMVSSWQIPSSTKWSIHHKAHNLVKSL
ncbi:hypothetical protein P691DRAFT_767211 [Macrolepiota fuliginosa MF-IS2]|uniref:Uncharacterized protein n=1 Tax=Macrolepiota fuliginosa MF-IS2 TaxID=1400762 RepID=A0A9P6BVI0_9AGAR|nr:hypothetical protein P691DRAFT_767211 [Macrolepiota fuliginosa MF-IS2]